MRLTKPAVVVGFLLLWAQLAAASVGVETLSPMDLGSTVPNFVVVVTDDQRWDTIGRCFPVFDGSDYTAGNQSCMPQVAQKLVDAGVTFLRGEVTQSLCCPSRASILTGLNSRHSGVVSNDGSTFDDSSTLVTWLDQANYRTGLFGKYLNSYGTGPLTGYIPPGWDSFHAFHGFDQSGQDPYADYSWIDWEDGDPSGVVTRNSTVNSTSVEACAPGNNYSTDLICAKAKSFLAADSATPFFLYLAPASPHTPYTVATRHTNAFNGLPLSVYPSHNVIPTPNPPGYLRPTPINARNMSRFADLRRQAMRTNLAVDDMVGQIHDQLSADGRLANTVWFFISDNGFASGEHRLTNKQCPYLECHRVPFVVVCPEGICPGAGVGTRDDANYALNIDIAPTIAELAGATPTLRMDGRSLVPILSNPTGPWRTEWVLFENDIPLDGVVAQSIDGQWYKYVVLRQTGETELYHLGNDSWELTNLWDNPDFGSVQADMASKLVDALNDPDLTITSSPPPTGNGSVVDIGFASSDSVTFMCALDGQGETACGTGFAGTVTYTDLTDGPHSVQIVGVDSFGNASPGAGVSFFVGAEPDTDPPTVPANLTGTIVGLDVSLIWEAATDNIGVDHYRIHRDGVEIGTSSSSDFLDLAPVPDTPHTYLVHAVDAAGNISGPSNVVIVAVSTVPDTTPPVVAIDAPTDGAVIAGLATVSLTATDDVGLARVELSIDGNVISILTVAPYQFGWNSTSVPDGTHLLSAAAIDTAGNTTTSSPVTVTVQNSDPTGQFTANPTSAVVGQTVTFSDAHTGGHRRTLFLGNGQTKTGRNPTFTYAYLTAGVYRVSLQTRHPITNASITLTLTVSVASP